MNETDPLRHNALRDTLWVGKGVHGVWFVVLGIVALAALAALALH
jgi:hypothetical protein